MIQITEKGEKKGALIKRRWKYIVSCRAIFNINAINLY